MPPEPVTRMALLFTSSPKFKIVSEKHFVKLTKIMNIVYIAENMEPAGRRCK
jgi:hypothetical protein